MSYNDLELTTMPLTQMSPLLQLNDKKKTKNTYIPSLHTLHPQLSPFLTLSFIPISILLL